MILVRFDGQADNNEAAFKSRRVGIGSTWPAEDTTDPLSMSKWNLLGKEIEGEFRDACFGEEKINGLDLSAKYYLKKGKKKKKYLYFSKEKVTMKII